MDRLRLAIAAPRAPTARGGVERMIGATARTLSSTGKVFVEVYCTGNKEAHEDCGDYLLHQYRGYTNAFCYSRRLREALARSDSDIIHAHSFTTYIPYAASFATNATRPMVLNTHYHSRGSTKFFDLARRAYDPIIGKRCIETAKRLICGSHDEIDHLCASFPNASNKVRLIPPGIDIEAIESSKPYFRCTGQKKLALYIGRLERYKNPHLLIPALKHAPNLSLIIIGTGPERRNLESMIASFGLEKRAKVLTGLDDGSVHRWLASCDVFVTLSDIESFGITVAEALAAGKPVLLNRQPSLAEFEAKFPNSVMGIDAHSMTSEGLAKALQERASITPKKEDLSEYSWTNVGTRILALYKEVLDGK